jgi:hypothetical protein
MLDRRSLPVWMLADSSIAASAAGAVVCMCVVTALGAVGMRKNQNAIRSKYEKLVDEKSELEQELALAQESSKHEGNYRKELLSVKGDFSRVIFVVDTSGSMGEPIDLKDIDSGWGVRPAPWNGVQDRVSAWLSHLPIQQFKIVCFNSEVSCFPKSPSQWLRANSGKEKAKSYLAAIQPGGFTSTEKALKTAIDRKPTSIVLFTDGLPTDGEGVADTLQQTRVLELVAKSKIPVNVVAMNNYFDRRQGAFLLLIAERSGGGYIAF